MDNAEFLAELDREENPLARQLCSLALERELVRRQLEREYAELPASERVKIQNTQDLRFCHEMVIEIREYLLHVHPTVTIGTERLLARLAGALHDTIVGSKPALFFDIDPEPFWKREGEGTKTGSSMAAANEGVAAFILHLLVSAMPKGAAIRWLDREIAALRFVDRLGQLITGKRIAAWRTNFSTGSGAAVGCKIFDISKEKHRELLRACKSDAKKQQVEELAHALLGRLVVNAAGDIPTPQR